jgi:hypothetical protein
MLDLGTAKEIILKRNEDDTYNMVAKLDILKSDNITKTEAVFEIYRVKINNFDIDILNKEMYTGM